MKEVSYNTMGLAKLRQQIQFWEGKLYHSIKKRDDVGTRQANTRLNHLYKKEDEILYPEENLVKSK